MPASRLASTDSPYLKEAAEQPVDWYPWGEEAFEVARKLDRPVLVDSGAVWCHWCHVMDHESYVDPETAALINDRFVAVKLDRDERPDVDGRLQQAVGALTGRGGWPLTAFLTPEGQVFYGGTYFPPEPQGKMPAFRQVLAEVARLFEQERDRVEDQAQHIREALASDGPPASGPAPDLAGLGSVVDDALSRHDPAHGGFGSAPKFPHPSTHDLLLAWHLGGHDQGEAAWDTLAHTLEAMSVGGIHDQLAGGFHRYSVDRHWTVPHFEKMLYDNGPLLANYARAAAVARRRGDPRAARFEATARDTERFLLAVLQRPGGGFGGSQDADRRPDEEGPMQREQLDDGEYFTWTLEAVRQVLEGDHLRVARLHFGIDEQGDMHHDPRQNVLRAEATPQDLAEVLDRPVDEVERLLTEAIERLREARSEREAPVVDPTVYTNWNGLAIAALFDHHRLLNAPKARRAAEQALALIVEEGLDAEEGLCHALTEGRGRVHGLLDDHAQLLPALVGAHQATGQASHLDHARTIANLLVQRFWMDDGRLTETMDGNEPAGVADQPTASAAATVLLHLPRLARLTGDEGLAERAREGLVAYGGQRERLGPVFGGTYHLAALAHADPPPHTVVVGEGPEAEALVAVARSHPSPLATHLQVSDPGAPGVPDEARAAARAFEGEAAAVVCRGRACQLARSSAELERVLWQRASADGEGHRR